MTAGAYVEEFDVAGYSLAHRRLGTGGRDLIVVLSTKRSFAMYRMELGRDAVFVADHRIGYYVHRPRALAMALMAIADRDGYERILVVGGSKAGFGALLVGGLCARLRPRRVIRVLAFQPRIRIFPYEPQRTPPSYHRQYAFAGKTSGRRRDMRRFGDAAFVAELPNAVVRIVYPQFNPEDAGAALSLTGPNVSHFAAPTAIHNTHAFVSLVAKSEAAIRAGVERMCDTQEADEGVLVTAEQRREIVAQIVSNSDLPTLPAMIDAAFDATPVAPPPDWPREAASRRFRRTVRWLIEGLRPFPKVAPPPLRSAAAAVQDA